METESSTCEECNEEYDTALDKFAKGPDGHCAKCRNEKLKNQGPPTTVAVSGERWYGKLDHDIRNLVEFHGPRGAIAAQVFRVYPSAQKATVLFNGKQRLFYRGDFEDPASGVELDQTPRFPAWQEKREEILDELN